MTPSETRDKLTDLALSVLDSSGKLPSGPRSRTYGELRDALEVKRGANGSMNGGNAATAGMKHCSGSPRSSYRDSVG